MEKRMEKLFDRMDTKIEYNRKETLGLIMFFVGIFIIVVRYGDIPSGSPCIDTSAGQLQDLL
jgi:hypothetical protein